MDESIQAQKEVICKRDYFYDWNALKIDPKSKTFGKPPKIIDDDENNHDSVANSLKFVCDETEMNKPLNIIRKNPMSEDFIYGIQTKANEDNKEWGVKECVHSDIA